MREQTKELLAQQGPAVPVVVEEKIDDLDLVIVKKCKKVMLECGFDLFKQALQRGSSKDKERWFNATLRALDSIERCIMNQEVYRSMEHSNWVDKVMRRRLKRAKAEAKPARERKED